jgi:hypothetical protein
MAQQQQSESPFQSMQATAALMAWLARIFSTPVAVLLHEEYGWRFLGFTGPLAVLPFLILPAFFPKEAPWPILTLLALYIGRCTWVRIKQISQRWRRIPPKNHTRYAGTPWLLRLRPQWREETALWMEALGVLVLGFGTWWLNRPLGLFLILAALGHALWLAIQMTYSANQTLDMHDNAVAQQAVAERFRETQQQV